MQCNKLKAAYLIAVRIKNRAAIQRIRQIALETDNKAIIGICDAYLKGAEDTT
jgi:hypothetical protein